MPNALQRCTHRHTCTNGCVLSCTISYFPSQVPAATGNRAPTPVAQFKSSLLSVVRCVGKWCIVRTTARIVLSTHSIHRCMSVQRANHHLRLCHDNTHTETHTKNLWARKTFIIGELKFYFVQSPREDDARMQKIIIIIISRKAVKWMRKHTERLPASTIAAAAADAAVANVAMIYEHVSGAEHTHTTHGVLLPWPEMSLQLFYFFLSLQSRNRNECLSSCVTDIHSRDSINRLYRGIHCWWQLSTLNKSRTHQQHFCYALSSSLLIAALQFS